MKKFVMNSLGSITEIQEDDEFTIRDYFAAHILQGLVANNLTCDDDEQVIASAWGLADKMIKARK